MRKPINKHKPWPGKVYRFYVVNREGHVVEGDLPTEEHARTVIDYWNSQGVYDLKILVDVATKTKKG